MRQFKIFIISFQSIYSFSFLHKIIDTQEALEKLTPCFLAIFRSAGTWKGLYTTSNIMNILAGSDSTLFFLGVIIHIWGFWSLFFMNMYMNAKESQEGEKEGGGYVWECCTGCIEEVFGKLIGVNYDYKWRIFNLIEINFF